MSKLEGWIRYNPETLEWTGDSCGSSLDIGINKRGLGSELTNRIKITIDLPKSQATAFPPTSDGETYSGDMDRK